MSKISKKQKTIREQLKPGQVYTPADAIDTLKALPGAKFTESVDAAIRLGVDPKKSDQMVRGATNLPKGNGKSVKVAVFAQGDNAQKAKDAGADIVGFEDLAEEIKQGNMNFDVLIASPDAMKLVGQLGQILGPRGLMPNPKVGTVTPHVANAVRDAKAGQVRYRTDKNGIIHCAIGTVKQESSDLVENLNALIADLRKMKPTTSKGTYIRKITLTTTMGPGLVVDISSITV